MRTLITTLLIASVCSIVVAKGPKITDRKNADKDFAVQGEYEGTLDVDGEDQKIGVQVIALGEGKFKSVGYFGGLPGAGWSGDEKHEGSGVWDGNSVAFEVDNVTATAKDGVMAVSYEGTPMGTLKRTERESPTLGQKPPKGAIVLFDGKSAEAWEKGKIENGLLKHGTWTKQNFQSHKLHIEFLLPYQPQERGQQRGNSGIYMQGRYEVQMLDSFGLSGEHNECGGIYSIKKPDVNMCLPPLQWQTYDIEFHAAKFEGKKMTGKPTMTVRHNGVLVHDKVELPKSTTASKFKPGPDPGPVYLQDHTCPVSYRNIWAVKL